MLCYDNTMYELLLKTYLFLSILDVDPVEERGLWNHVQNPMWSTSIVGPH